MLSKILQELPSSNWNDVILDLVCTIKVSFSPPPPSPIPELSVSTRSQRALSCIVSQLIVSCVLSLNGIVSLSGERNGEGLWLSRRAGPEFNTPASPVKESGSRWRKRLPLKILESCCHLKLTALTLMNRVWFIRRQLHVFKWHIGTSSSGIPPSL